MNDGYVCIGCDELLTVDEVRICVHGEMAVAPLCDNCLVNHQTVAHPEAVRQWVQ